MDEFVSTSDAAPGWNHLRGLLDEAMSELDETDYDALVLRFYQNCDLRAVGAAIGVSDDAAQKRVTRALDKLRERLARHDIRTTAAALSVALSANAVQAAPAGLAVTVSAAALAGTATTTSTVLAATTKAIAMTTLQKGLVATTLAVLAGVGIYSVRQNLNLREQVRVLRHQHASLQGHIQQLHSERDEASRQITALREDNTRLSSGSAELLKLRGEVGLLRKQAGEVDRLRTENLTLQRQVQTDTQAALNPVTAPIIARVVFTRIKQPQAVSQDIIRTNISVREGDVLDQASVDGDMQRLYGTGWFANIRVEKTSANDGVTLNYLVQEKPRLSRINFSGNNRIDAQTLSMLITSKVGRPMDGRTLSEDAQRIQELYEQLGRPNASVKFISHTNEEDGDGVATFQIVE